MHNFYNILPTILIDILIILIFEGLLFFLYLEKMQENIINDQLNNFFKKLSDSKSSSNDILYLFIENTLQPYIKNAIDQEYQYNTNQYKLGIIIYGISLVSIVILLLGYSYVVVNILHKTLDWKTILITVFITIFLIIVMETLYVKYVLFNKKFNESQIKLDFVNAVIE